MPDANLREAMARSLQETRRDPYETPTTGGASGSGAMAQHAPSHSRQARPTRSLKGKDQSSPKVNQE